MRRRDTPILVAAGQFVDRAATTAGLSPVDIAAAAGMAAFKSLPAGVDVDKLKESIDTVLATRLFMHSMGDSNIWTSACGSSNNIPRSIANRLNLIPNQLIYAEVGGESPQRYVNQLAECIYRGEIKSALLTGAEALRTVKNARRHNLTIDWNETVDATYENRIIKKPLASNNEIRHGITLPTQVYALFEQARRAKRGLDIQGYRDEIGSMLLPFAEISARNPYSQHAIQMSARDIAIPSCRNYLLSEPYTKHMVAQDNVNQGASVVLTSIGLAEEIGIPEACWVHLLSYSDVDELPILQRPDLAQSMAQELSIQKVLRDADCMIKDISLVDIYSCFPIVVFNSCQYLGIDFERVCEMNPLKLTVTGGLPFFGGPGNNYSLHAIAELVSRLGIRRGSDDIGMVVANGGYLSKHSSGIYCSRQEWLKKQCNWSLRCSDTEQSIVNQNTVEVDDQPNGPAIVETYSAVYGKSGIEKSFCIVIGRVIAKGKRFVALAENNSDTLDFFFNYDANIFGSTIEVRHDITKGLSFVRML